MKTEAVHMAHIRGESAQQFPKRAVVSASGRGLAEWQKVVAYAAAFQLLHMCTCLNYRHASAGLAGCVSHIDERRPRHQQFLRQASRGVIEKAYLGDVHW